MRQTKKLSGVFIAFEGGEGAGKSTQIRLLDSWLRDQGITPILTREPGGTEIGKTIRAILLDPRNQHLDPRAEALLYQSDRAQHVGEIVRPALENGRWVLTDRYFYSSIVYQGVSRNIGFSEVGGLSKFATAGLVPQLVILLDISAEAGMARIQGRGQKDRMESEALQFHKKVRKGFLQLASREKKRFVVLDATKSEAYLSEKIKDVVQAKFKKFLGRRA